jgi:hypothetical protein
MALLTQSSLAAGLGLVLLSGIEVGCAPRSSRNRPGLDPKSPVSVNEQARASGVGCDCDSAQHAHLDTLDEVLRSTELRTKQLRSLLQTVAEGLSPDEGRKLDCLRAQLRNQNEKLRRLRADVILLRELAGAMPCELQAGVVAVTFRNGCPALELNATWACLGDQSGLAPPASQVLAATAGVIAPRPRRIELSLRGPNRRGAVGVLQLAADVLAEAGVTKKRIALAEPDDNVDDGSMDEEHDTSPLHVDPAEVLGEPRLVLLLPRE